MAQPVPAARVACAPMTEQSQEWFTVNEAATYCRVTRGTIYRWLNAGLLAGHRTTGGGLRFRRGALDDAMQGVAPA